MTYVQTVRRDFLVILTGFALGLTALALLSWSLGLVSSTDLRNACLVNGGVFLGFLILTFAVRPIEPREKDCDSNEEE